MKGSYPLLVLALSFCGSGCITVRDAGVSTSRAFNTVDEDERERMRDRQWAETAWQQNGMANPQRVVSPDYGQGFKDGFAEHLRSGQEQPPRSAPSRYRGVEYQTPQGYRAIEDWFAGYRHGIASAVESGCRTWIAGPTTDRPAAPAVPPNAAPPAKVAPPPAAGPATLDQIGGFKRMPNDMPQLSAPFNPEIHFGKPQSTGQGPPALREMLLTPIGVDKAGDPPPMAVVPPPTLGGPQPPIVVIGPIATGHGVAPGTLGGPQRPIVVLGAVRQE